ncbi:hypothetical protein AN958_12333 [Leucoagaricus sp. SymC.cos]|nr:hypothetical protein AN958_12333 [Leucoagaricus sp. SymC.cos]
MRFELYIVAGLAILVYDHLLNWDQELECVWKHRHWFITTCFFVSRYVALAGQTINVVFSSTFASGDGAENVENCFPWTTLQFITVLVLRGNMEIFMMAQVFALYERNRLLGIILALWFLLSRAIDIYSCLDAINGETDKFCIPKKSPDSALWFSAAMVFNQSLLWYLTFRKYRRAVNEGWSTYPVIRLVFRDNSWVVMAIGGVIVATLPYTFYVQQLDHVIFWYVPFVVPRTL